MKVWVLCRNDFPVGVVSSGKEAENWRKKNRIANNKEMAQPNNHTPWIAYHIHDFIVDGQ